MTLPISPRHAPYLKSSPPLQQLSLLPQHSVLVLIIPKLARDSLAIWKKRKRKRKGERESSFEFLFCLTV